MKETINNNYSQQVNTAQTQNTHGFLPSLSLLLCSPYFFAIPFNFIHGWANLYRSHETPRQAFPLRHSPRLVLRSAPVSLWLQFIPPLHLDRRIQWLRCQTWLGPSQITPLIQLSPQCLRRHPLSPPRHSHTRVPWPSHRIQSKHPFPWTSLPRRYYRFSRTVVSDPSLKASTIRFTATKNVYYNKKNCCNNIKVIAIVYAKCCNKIWGNNPMLQKNLLQ